MRIRGTQKQVDDYTQDQAISPKDKVVGQDSQFFKHTKNYTVQEIALQVRGGDGGYGQVLTNNGDGTWSFQGDIQVTTTTTTLDPGATTTTTAAPGTTTTTTSAPLTTTTTTSAPGTTTTTTSAPVTTTTTQAATTTTTTQAATTTTTTAAATTTTTTQAGTTTTTTAAATTTTTTQAFTSYALQYPVTDTSTDFTTYEITDTSGGKWEVTVKGISLLKSAATPTIVSGGSGVTIGSAGTNQLNEWGYDGNVVTNVQYGETLYDLYNQTGTYITKGVNFKNGSSTNWYVVGCGIHNDNKKTVAGTFYQPDGYYRYGFPGATMDYAEVQNGIVQSLGQITSSPTTTTTTTTQAATTTTTTTYAGGTRWTASSIEGNGTFQKTEPCSATSTSNYANIYMFSGTTVINTIGEIETLLANGNSIIAYSADVGPDPSVYPGYEWDGESGTQTIFDGWYGVTTNLTAAPDASIQIDANGNVLAIYNCSSGITTPTTTTTTTTAAPTTTTTTVFPPAGWYEFYASGTSSLVARLSAPDCNYSPLQWKLYHQASSSQTTYPSPLPNLNDILYVYPDAQSYNLYNGGYSPNDWIAISSDGVNVYASIRVDTNGKVIQIQYPPCSTTTTTTTAAPTTTTTTTAATTTTTTMSTPATIPSANTSTGYRYPKTIADVDGNLVHNSYNFLTTSVINNIHDTTYYGTGTSFFSFYVDTNTVQIGSFLYEANGYIFDDNNTHQTGTTNYTAWADLPNVNYTPLKAITGDYIVNGIWDLYPIYKFEKVNGYLRCTEIITSGPL